jgi:HMG (high mobility group) box
MGMGQTSLPHPFNQVWHSQLQLGKSQHEKSPESPAECGEMKTPTSYLLFFQANHRRIKEKNPTASSRKVARIAGLMWRGEDKQTWHQDAAMLQ